RLGIARIDQCTFAGSQEARSLASYLSHFIADISSIPGFTLPDQCAQLDSVAEFCPKCSITFENKIVFTRIDGRPGRSVLHQFDAFGDQVERFFVYRLTVFVSWSDKYSPLQCIVERDTVIYVYQPQEMPALHDPG